MSVCKDCVHYKACVSFWYSHYDWDCNSFEESEEKNANRKACDYFNPTADVVEVRHGEWIERSYGELQCSVCGIVQEDEPHRYNYCPNCGAKMDGERSENGT